MFSTMTNSEGFTSAVIDFGAISSVSLGELISVTERKLKDAEIDEMSFEVYTLGEVLRGAKAKLEKFSILAVNLNKDGFELDTKVEVAYNKGVKVLRDLESGEGYKAVRGKMMTL